jgi:short-subunit dehydrogenase
MIHTKHERWALVTGASAGIGFAFADVLAKNGFNVALMARRREHLQKHANWLEDKYNAKTLVIVDDLEDPAAPDRIFSQTEQAGIKLDLLVNNAGYGVPGHFESVPADKHLASLQVMLTSVVQLTHKYLPGMQERDYGRIVNVASLAALVPGSSGHTLYGAQKSFLVKFSESLWAENQGTNVHVTALCPGFTYSEFHDVTGNRDQVSELPKFMWMDAKTVAEQGFKAVCDNKPVYVNGAWNKFLAGLTKILPSFVGYAIMKRMSARVRRQEM